MCVQSKLYRRSSPNFTFWDGRNSVYHPYVGPNTKDAILGNSRKEQLCFCILDFPVEQMVSGWVVRGFDGLWEDNLSLFYPQCFPYNLVSLRLYVGLHTKVNELNLKYPW